MWMAAVASIIISWTFSYLPEQVNVNTTEFHLFGEHDNEVVALVSIISWTIFLP